MDIARDNPRNWVPRDKESMWVTPPPFSSLRWMPPAHQSVYRGAVANIIPCIYAPCRCAWFPMATPNLTVAPLAFQTVQQPQQPPSAHRHQPSLTELDVSSTCCSLTPSLRPHTCSGSGSASCGSASQLTQAPEMPVPTSAFTFGGFYLLWVAVGQQASRHAGPTHTGTKPSFFFVLPLLFASILSGPTPAVVGGIVSAATSKLTQHAGPHIQCPPPCHVPQQHPTVTHTRTHIQAHAHTYTKTNTHAHTLHAHAHTHTPTPTP